MNSMDEGRMKVEMACKILMAWRIVENKNEVICGEGDDLYDDSFICKVLTKKMQAFQTGIKVPNLLSVLLEVCTDANPGQSQLLLADIIRELPKPIPEEYTITTDDFTTAFKDLMPVVSRYKEVEERLANEWKEQKFPMDTKTFADNGVDTREWWMEVLGR